VFGAHVWANLTLAKDLTEKGFLDNSSDVQEALLAGKADSPGVLELWTGFKQLPYPPDRSKIGRDFQQCNENVTLAKSE
jgi:hypothetical protein